jgi:hypothetical protein
MKSFLLSKKGILFGLKIAIIALLLNVLNTISCLAQTDSTYKNTIRFNITNPMIFGEKSLSIGYERLLKNDQSFSVNIGRASFPFASTITVDSVEMERGFTEKGFHISADYRFYLKRLNKFETPRGVYIGPYYSYNYYERTNGWLLSSFPGSIKSDMTISIHSAGLELGYQFVFWKKLSVDMILIGPGIGFYSVKATLNTDLTDSDQQKLFNALNQLLADKIPGYSQIISGDGFKRTGVEKTTALGYRYMVLVGFRF